MRSATDRAAVLDRSIASCRPMVQEINIHVNSAKNSPSQPHEKR